MSDAVNDLIKAWLTFISPTVVFRCWHVILNAFIGFPAPWLERYNSFPVLTGNSSQQPFISLLRESELTTWHFFLWNLHRVWFPDKHASFSRWKSHDLLQHDTARFVSASHHQKDGAHLKQSCLKYIWLNSITPLFSNIYAIYTTLGRKVLIQQGKQKVCRIHL